MRNSGRRKLFVEFLKRGQFGEVIFCLDLGIVSWRFRLRGSLMRQLRSRRLMFALFVLKLLVWKLETLSENCKGADLESYYPLGKTS